MKGLIALLLPIFFLLLGIYIKYRFHIQFIMLIRRGYKYLMKKRNDSDERRRSS